MTGWFAQALALGWLVVVTPRFRKETALPGHYQMTNLVAYKRLVLRERQPKSQFPVATPNTGREGFQAAKQGVAALVVALPVRRISGGKQLEPEITAPELKLESQVPVMPTEPTSKIIAVNTFSSDPSTVTTVAKSTAAVQTGGFDGINGNSGSKNRRVTNVREQGAFGLSNGSEHDNPMKRTNPGVVMSAGFASEVAISAGKSVGVSQQVGFNAHNSEIESHRPSNEANAPVEITFKPKPDYTDEGRKLGINGEVSLEVLFSADGRVHVMRVIQGLGHGLDEQAVKAAEQIKFKPALRIGQPIDSIALVHIIFELVS